MKKIISIVLAAVLIVVLIGVGAIYLYPKIVQNENPAQSGETVMPVQQGLGDLPSGTDVGPDLGSPAVGDMALPVGPESSPEAPIGESSDAGEMVPASDADATRALTPSKAAGTATAKRDIAPAATPTQREQRTTTTTGTRPGVTATSPTGVQPAGTQPTEILPIAGPEVITAEVPTPTPVAGSVPEATPTVGQAPAPGTYSVRTLEPVLEAKLRDIQKAMNRLGVELQKQKIGQQMVQQYRVAVGYFRSKAEAESWAQYYFKPQKVAYYVYPAQGMYSLQVGVYSQAQNAEAAMRDLDRKFPGWRLPVRREVANTSTAAYQLSIRQISKALADQIWRELNRLDVPAEISGL